MKPSIQETQQRVARIIEILKETWPDAQCALDHETPYQLLVATILSAQCTDKRVNLVTPEIFSRYPDATALAKADPQEVETLIQSTGFFRNKARSLLGMAQSVTDNHHGQIPDTMEALTRLPGVGRKTANVILGTAFGKNDGVVVDTHVARLAGLLKLTDQKDPPRIETDLMAVVDQQEWTNFAHLLIHHGRNICVARRPQCSACPLYNYCPNHRVDAPEPETLTPSARKPPVSRRLRQEGHDTARDSG